MTKHLTVEEAEDGVTKVLFHFRDMLEDESTSRADTLAPSDRALLSDSRISLDFLLSRISREPKLCLSKRIQGLATSVGELMESTNNSAGTSFLPLTKVDHFYHDVQDVVVFATTMFDPTKYGRVGFWGRFMESWSRDDA